MTRKRDLVAYCGLYCDDCMAREGRIADLATELERELKKAGFERFVDAVSDVPFFKALKKYPDFNDVLDVLKKSRCTKTCKEGGANPACEVRICCKEKGIEGCWVCGEFVECEKLVFLEGVHGIAHIRNLRRLKRKGVAEFVKGRHDWYVKPPSKKPADKTSRRSVGTVGRKRPVAKKK